MNAESRSRRKREAGRSRRLWLSALLPLVIGCNSLQFRVGVGTYAYHTLGDTDFDSCFVATERTYWSPALTEMYLQNWRDRTMARRKEQELALKRYSSPGCGLLPPHMLARRPTLEDTTPLLLTSQVSSLHEAFDCTLRTAPEEDRSILLEAPRLAATMDLDLGRPDSTEHKDFSLGGAVTTTALASVAP